MPCFALPFPGCRSFGFIEGLREIFASLLRKPAGWINIQQSPSLADTLFGISGWEAQHLTRGEFLTDPGRR